MKKLLSFISGGVFAVALLAAGTAYAVVSYPPGALLQPNDVTSSHIRDATISNIDISGTANISGTKVNPRGENGAVLFSTGSAVGTTTSLFYDTLAQTLLIGTTTRGLAATSTGSLYAAGLVQASTIEATSTLKLRGVAYTPPSADGTSGQALTTNGSAGLSWSSPASLYTASSFTAGQTLDTGDAVVVASTTATAQQLFNNALTDAANVFGTAGVQQRSTDITESSAVCFNTIQARFKKNNTPTDNVVWGVQTDTAGAPSGTWLLSSTTAAGAISTSYANYTHSTTTTMCLTAATKYWFVYSRDGAMHATNNYDNGQNGSGGYANGQEYYYNGTSWTANGPQDDYFGLFMVQTAGRVFKTDANWPGFYENFIGFVLATSTVGSSVSVITSGEASGVLGVSAGYNYYLANTEGDVQTTAGANSRKVGQGIGSNKIIVTNIW